MSQLEDGWNWFEEVEDGSRELSGDDTDGGYPVMILIQPGFLG